MGWIRQIRCNREQVAAVCYRVRGGDIEFLLVQSRGGRWIFPKGSIEPGLTRAQSAALEAFEEAGVRGRIETAPFSRYTRRNGKRASRPLALRSSSSTVVHTYLCEVRKLVAPQESDRNRSWLSSEKAKRRLRQDRAADVGEELAGVIDRAICRIRRLQTGSSSRGLCDVLQQTRLEAYEYTSALTRASASALMRYLRDARQSTLSAVRVISPESFRRAQLRLGPGSRNSSTRAK
jgi:8-oxo-dGTP pyrophosphatase MutT (NUDIX family)